jgi:hypothetical protein
MKFLDVALAKLENFAGDQESSDRHDIVNWVLVGFIAMIAITQII